MVNVQPVTTGGQFVSEVAKFIGDPYVYGATGPTSFDCSGLVQYALEQLGFTNVPRTSEDQWAWVSPIKQSDLQPGDLVFSQWPGDDASPGHVAIYAGAGQLIEAPKPGESVHEIALNSYYQQFVTGYGRIPNLSQTGSTAGTGTTGTTGTGGSGTGTATQTDWSKSIGGFIGGITGLGDVAAMLGTVFGPISNVFKDLGQALNIAVTGLIWLVNPMNWLRIFAGIVGGVAVIAGAVLVATSG